MDIDDTFQPSSAPHLREQKKVSVESAEVAKSLTEAVRKHRAFGDVLQDYRPEVIRLACRTLPNDVVIPIVKELLDRLRSFKRELYIVRWMQAIIRSHMSVLVREPSSRALLVDFFNETTEQLDAWPSVLPLEGRLSLIEDQIHGRKTFQEEGDQLTTVEEGQKSSDEDEDEEEPDTDDDEDENENAEDFEANDSSSSVSL